MNTAVGKALAAKADELLTGQTLASSCPADDFQDFNELLCLGYMEGDSIGVGTLMIPEPFFQATNQAPIF